MNSITFSENSPTLWKNLFPQVKPADNKYTRGHLLINGAPLDSTGATKLAAFAAARAGAGMVTVACEEEALPVYAASFQSIMAKPMDDGQFMDFMRERKISAILLGPGNRTTDAAKKRVLEVLKNKTMRTVLDADAISAFERDRNLLFNSLHPNCVLTPHEGEFKRLFSLKAHPANVKQDDSERVAAAVAAAKASNAIIVLKGNTTVIAAPDGRTVTNSNAPTNLATAGSGDVLAGIIAALFAQNMPCFEATCAGVWLHTEAAKLAGAGLIADDLPGLIPQVLGKL